MGKNEGLMGPKIVRVKKKKLIFGEGVEGSLGESAEEVGGAHFSSPLVRWTEKKNEEGECDLIYLRNNPPTKDRERATGPLPLAFLRLGNTG